MTKQIIYCWHDLARYFEIIFVIRYILFTKSWRYVFLRIHTVLSNIFFFWFKYYPKWFFIKYLTEIYINFFCVLKIYYDLRGAVCLLSNTTRKTIKKCSSNEVENDWYCITFVVVGNGATSHTRHTRFEGKYILPCQSMWIV